MNVSVDKDVAEDLISYKLRNIQKIYFSISLIRVDL